MKVEAYFTRTVTYIREIELPDGTDLDQAGIYPTSHLIWDELDRTGQVIKGMPEDYLDDAEIDHVELAKTPGRHPHVHPSPTCAGGPFCHNLTDEEVARILEELSTQDGEEV